jgi:hypothetical protein
LLSSHTHNRQAAALCEDPQRAQQQVRLQKAAAVLGCILLWLVIFVYQAAGVARIILWLVSPATLWFAWRTLVNNGASYLHADGTGPDDETARAEMNMVNDLTPWRFSGWYCSVTVGFGIASMFFVVSAAILLAVPGS